MLNTKVDRTDIPQRLTATIVRPTAPKAKRAPAEPPAAAPTAKPPVAPPRAKLPPPALPKQTPKLTPPPAVEKAVAPVKKAVAPVVNRVKGGSTSGQFREKNCGAGPSGSATHSVQYDRNARVAKLADARDLKDCPQLL